MKPPMMKGKMAGKGKTKQVKKQTGGFPKPRVQDPTPVGYPIGIKPKAKKKLEDL